MTRIPELEHEDGEAAETGTRHRALVAENGVVRVVTLDEAVAYIRGPGTHVERGPGTHVERGPGAHVERGPGAHVERGPGAHERPPDAASGAHAPLVWLDILRPTPEDGTLLRERLHVHPLVVEDCLSGRQNPKLERYPGYFFIVVYAARINPERNRPAFYELHCLVGQNYLLTVRQESVREVRNVMARWRSGPAHFVTVGHIAHALLDSMVDSYFPMVDHFAVRVDATENEAYEHPEDAMQHIMSLRRELLRFRNLVGPTRDMLSSVLRRDLPFLNPELMPYFQDVRDHAVRVTEEIDLLRDLLSTAVEAQFTVTSNQLNRTVRMMTAWSIILMSMTLIAGIYGMNFVLMPELEWRWGYPLSVGLMAVVGTSLFVFFRRRRWL